MLLSEISEFNRNCFIFCVSFTRLDKDLEKTVTNNYEHSPLLNLCRCTEPYCKSTCYAEIHVYEQDKNMEK